jgi:DASS family divalent anion:Na+ symporter
MVVLLKWVFLFALGLGIYSLPVPEGLDPKGWQLFAIFVPTIVGIIIRPMPMGPLSLMAMLICCLTGVLDAKSAFSGFGHSVVWLVVIVFFIARGFIKTQLGARIAYVFVSILGRKPLGMAYGLVMTELVIAPFIPSNTARSGGILFPILKSINLALGSSPEDGTERKVGAYLTQVLFQGNLITSAMFLTAMAANPMAQAFAAKMGIHISWTLWAKAAIVPGLISCIVIPLLLYIIYPPTARELPEAVDMAKAKLKEMGPFSRNEWSMLAAFGVMLTLWVMGDHIGISATVTALIGLSILLITDVINWNDVLNEHEAWNILIWLSILVMMSGFLETFGFVSWFSGNVSSYVADIGWHKAFLILALVYFYSHYFFASNTAHVSAMYAGFLGASVAAGAPGILAALVLGYFSNLFSSMTHYGTSPAAILYGTGYVSMGAWWGYGLVVSIVNVLIWLILGGMWWKFIGIW